MIGNGAYTDIPALRNASNDARLIAERLRSIGFEVTLEVDLDRRGFVRTLSAFRRSLDGATTGLFFFAGHGVQADGSNYLIPTDATLDAADVLSLEAINLDQVTEILNETTKTVLIFLDACRNNPFENGTSRSAATTTRGLARVSAESNTLISFAAAPGNVALDRVEGVSNDNSPFTTALSRHLGTPGDTINRTMIKVRRDVLEMTEGKQVPWEHSSLVDEVTLRFGQPGADGGITQDEGDWELVLGSTDPAVFERFITRNPDSRFVPVAQERIVTLRAAQEAARTDVERAALAAEAERQAEAQRDLALAAFYAPPAPPDVRGTFKDCDSCPEMVDIKGTEFLFGAPDPIKRAQPDERPARRVAMSTPFAVAITATTRADFDLFVRETGHLWPDACMITASDDTLPVLGSRKASVSDSPDLPVVCVSWEDAKAYVEWLSQKTGQSYRLLTELEFEYLAEAFRFLQDQDEIFDGRNICDVVNIADLSAPFSWRNFSCTNAHGFGIMPAASMPPDQFGLHHLLGNVWEWTQDCYADTPEAAEQRAIAPQEGPCDRKSMRGGSWADPLSVVRTSNRNWDRPSFRADTVGFRVARAAGNQ
ncbi:formylglycine-generating enzyme required for sulfatase activity [Pseudorhodobacter sp. 4114]|nr:formylglycine-generating enzyme required for sulfatase activity [Pseudorhodobacter sp. 4114]